MNKKMLWILVAVVAVSVVTNVFLVIAYFQAQNKFDDLSTVYDEVVVERNSLDAQVDALVIENDVLDSEVSGLTAERDALKSEVDSVVAERDSAKAEAEEYFGINSILIADNNALESERDALKAEVAALIIERDEALAEVAKMAPEYESLKEPNIVTINLQSSDERAYNPDRLEISGYLVNVGGSPAYNVKVQVEAYDSLDNLVINTTAYEMNWLHPAGHNYINTYVSYEGQPLADWTITVVWDA
ncbi:MAG: hypothetical protein NWF06_10505 [Candidatus Bathyarchaeota archaeon]|nr:hypothetical protein [Candidatus Bathyarchaeum sp.]